LINLYGLFCVWLDSKMNIKNPIVKELQAVHCRQNSY